MPTPSHGEPEAKEFAQRLKTLLTESPLSTGKLGEKIQLSKTRVSEISNGRWVSPPDFDLVVRWVGACANAIRRSGRIPSVATEVEWWQLAHGRLTRAFEIERARQRAETASLVAVAQHDPMKLGVHRTITAGSFRGPDLTPYVNRMHDRRLRELLAKAVSLLVVLTGGSSTGKTRAMWEAVSSQLPAWRLAKPVDAAELLVMLAEARAGTVFWLDEMQDFLTGAQGAAVAAALGRALRSDNPIVVIGSMWSEHWETLTGLAPLGTQDEYRLVRELLLKQAIEVVVPETLTRPSADAEATQTDARMELAWDTATDGRVIQVLAGGEHLVNRFEREQDIFGTALITAAMDAKRLGFHAPLPISLLQNALAGYLTPTQRVGSDDWATSALRHATAEINGVAALALCRSAGDIGPPDSVILHDYLHQYARHTRQGKTIPTSAWEAIAAEVSDLEDLRRMAKSARARMHFGYAETLYRRLIQRGDLHTAADLATMLADQGRVPDAERELRAVADSTYPHIRTQLARLLVSEKRYDDALTEYELAVAADYLLARPEMAQLLARMGRTDQAIDQFRTASAEGWLLSSEPLAELLAAHGRVSEALACLQNDIDRAGEASQFAVDAKAQFLESISQVAEAIELLRESLDSNPQPYLRSRLVALLARHGHVAAAEDLLQEAAESGDQAASRQLAQFLLQNGQDDAGIARLVQLSESGNTTAQLELVKALKAAGRMGEAAAAADSALRLLAEAVAGGDDSARMRRAFLLIDLGRTAEGLAEMRIAAETDDLARFSLAKFLDIYGYREEALSEMLTAAEGGKIGVHNELIYGLTHRGQHAQAERVRRYGITPDGKISDGGA